MTRGTILGCRAGASRGRGAQLAARAFAADRSLRRSRRAPKEKAMRGLASKVRAIGELVRRGGLRHPFAMAAYVRGRRERLRGRPENAARALGWAHEHAPEISIYGLQLAVALREDGRPQEAAEILRGLLEAQRERPAEPRDGRRGDGAAGDARRGAGGRQRSWVISPTTWPGPRSFRPHSGTSAPSGSWSRRPERRRQSAGWAAGSWPWRWSRRVSQAGRWSWPGTTTPPRRSVSPPRCARRPGLVTAARREPD